VTFLLWNCSLRELTIPGILAHLLQRGVKGGGTVLLKLMCRTLRGHIERREAVRSVSFNLETVVVIRICKIKAVGRANADCCSVSPAVLELGATH